MGSRDCVQYDSSRSRSTFKIPPGLTTLRTTRTMPSWDLEISATALPPSYPLLQFWTVSAHFIVRKPEKSFSNHHTKLLDILDKQRERCGFLIPDTDNMPVADSGTIELILLCQGGSRISEDAFPGDVEIENKLYWVMYIKSDRHISERRGLGHLYRHALKNAVSGPVWKEIVLG
jgi:hypothetical protein